MDHATTYEAARARIVDLVKNGEVETPVPTCPGWSVKDVVAHLAGSLGAYIAGDLEGASSPRWGDEQVEQRRDLSLEECLAEWERVAGRPGDLFESRLAPVAVADILAHEQDIRTALGRPRHSEVKGIIASLELALGFIDQKARSLGLPRLTIVTEDLEKDIGEGEPAGSLRTSTFELWRTLHGRRSVAQVRALEWTEDPATWIDALFLFGPAATDIDE